MDEIFVGSVDERRGVRKDSRQVGRVRAGLRRLIEEQKRIVRDSKTAADKIRFVLIGYNQLNEAQKRALREAVELLERD
jgi:predicted DNA binding protein